MNASPYAQSEGHDRMAILNVIADWGIFRDCGRWDLLSNLYAADAVMVTTWFKGSATEFISRSKASFERGARGQHFIGNSSISVNKDRAIADTRMSIMLRAKIEHTEVDVTCIGRFHDRFVREAGQWRIFIRTPVYDKDRIDPVTPGSGLRLDTDVLSRFAAGYRHLAYCQSLAGDKLTPGLPTPGSPEETALVDESAAWLSSQA
ncbi:MAG: nuclear transport factor 2 family protein [Bradyrhizobium sp.]|nr:nuclear transport factor 2 family protein [Bradyrhizobium sp.]